MIVDRALFDYFYDSIANGGVPDCPRCIKPQTVVYPQNPEQAHIIAKCGSCNIRYIHSLELSHREIDINIIGDDVKYSIIWDAHGCSIWLRAGEAPKVMQHIMDIDVSFIDITTIDLARVQKMLMLQ
jgi:hypothetical protein